MPVEEDKMIENKIPIATDEEDRRWNEEFRAKWSGTPYPPMFVTADAIVLHRGKILLIRRAGMPGRGRLALPGGYVEHSELIQDAAVRELIEEARPASQRGPLQPRFLKDRITGWRVFDDPKRAARGRVITIAYVFELPDQDEVDVTAGDDAGAVDWHEIHSLDTAELFEKHREILQEMVLSRQLRRNGCTPR
jgi:bifunctional NMN adenylyltransferase/nudix hydrolase